MARQFSVTVTTDSKDAIRARLDTKIEAYLTFSGHNAGLRGTQFGFKPREEYVKRVASTLVHPFTKTKEDDREWHESYLAEIEELHTGDTGSVWRVLIIEPATD